ncbi:DUF1129 domain-containing protein [Chitinophaga cymbidii]|uniref:Uncharacterized protein n=1 Tax=Chitinophaga cymbidii TaxID=1096750 RepID=A0A512RG68_9BACT|nr:hypothetical protein [Chitinophaga cymbidii]GEP94699.1 hypothetical protein CCY01nite_09590 [Chitinophaga cymbidii]
MKIDKRTSDRLSAMMKERGLDAAPEGLSDRLVNIAVRSYKSNYSMRYKKEERIGKGILFVLVLLNLWMLYILLPGAIHPALPAGVAALAVGLGVMIRLNKWRYAG